MISAAEAAMYMAAEDDAARARIEAKLYAPPRGPRPVRRQAQQRSQAPSAGMTRVDARSLMAQLAAQDAQLGLG
ncbi:hypothetical protein ACWCPM_05595 [Streptomyces sp. NPDC002309]